MRALALVFLIAGLAAPPPLPQSPFPAERASQLRTDWATALQVSPEFTNSIGMKLVLIPPGRFEMGPNGSRRRVTLAKPYYLGVTEVTLGQYRHFKAAHAIAGAEAGFNAPDRPAAMMSWNDARDFCAWLSDRPEEKSMRRK